MRFSLSAIAFAASLATVGAQDLSGIPDCAIPCFAAAVPESGCDVSDTECQCTTGREPLQSSLTECVPDKCSESEVSDVSEAVVQICADAGVTVSNVPTSAPTASGATNSSGNASMTGSPSGTGAPAENTGGASAGNVIGLGAVAFGMAAGVFGL